jgi:integrative and conjugative element protein (TIGR02256 family)
MKLNNLSWITLYPELYREERRLVEKHYPRMKLCTSLLEGGVLAFHGEIMVHGSGGITKHNVLLLYPSLFPYRVPRLIPVHSLPEDEPHPNSWSNPVIISARHQMADGNLCLVEPDPFREEPDVVRGVDILRRARAWFFGVRSGHSPYDSLEADLQAHFTRAGDILIGPEFFDDELRKGGYFYAARLWELPTTLWRFVALAFSSDFEELAKFKDCRASLERPFPWVDQKFWDAAQQVAEGTADFKEASQKELVIRGLWWDLKQEPMPPRTGIDVLRLVSDKDDPRGLERVLETFKGDISTDTYLYVGLRFPDRRGHYDWLFLFIVIRQKREPHPLILSTDEKIALMERSKVYALHRHPLLQRELTFRNTGRVPAGISDRQIAMLGVGALGSVMADLFAKAGVGTLRLYDQDVLQVGNVSRHLCGIESFGESKVEAVELKLIQHNPFSKIVPKLVDLVESYDVLGGALSDCDLAVSTTADESLEAAVNEVAVAGSQTVYYVRGMRGGTAGRIFRVIPGRDACRYCISTLMKKAQSEEAHPAAWIHVPELEGTLLSHECGNPVLAGSGVDLTLISSLAARVVLNDLAGGFGDDNHWLWASESIPGHSVLDKPFNLVARRLERDPDCPFCADPPVRQVLVPPDVQEQLERRAIEAGDKETCGILIGYFTDERVAVVVDASDAGPNAESSAAICSRDVEYTQQWLEDRLRDSSGEIEYIGEWHSHTSEDTTPSTTDTTSLTDIANSPNYLCRTPVMLILGCSEGVIRRKSAYCFAASRPFREIDYEVGEGATRTPNSLLSKDKSFHD